MELTSNLAQVIQDVVLRPDFTSAVGLFAVSIVNELLSMFVFPYSIILSGQLLFIDGSFSISVVAKLAILVAIPFGLGTTLGSLPFYGLAYVGGRPTIEKFGKHLKLSWGKVEKISSKFNGSWYDEILFLALRSIPLLPGLPISVAAGILRMRLVPYFVLTFIGTMIRIMIMLLIVGFGVDSIAR